MTDDEMMDLIEKRPVPTCAHPRAVGEEKDGQAVRHCPDCGKSWGYPVPTD
jgi:hypothetical protein